MKNALVLMFTLLVATAASAASLRETIDRTIDVRPGATFALTNVNGRVTVSSWDQPRVRVVARKSVQASRGQVEDVMNALRVNIQPRDGGVVVSTDYPKRTNSGGSIFDWFTGDDVQANVQYDIMVPRSMNIDVRTTNGAVRLDAVAGTHRLRSTNGRIDVSRSAGSTDVATTNGSIHVELLRVTPNQSMRFASTNGRISVTLPPDARVDVDAATTNGSFRSDLPVTTTQFSRRKMRGSINGGGPELKMRTTNGAIEIRAAGKS